MKKLISFILILFCFGGHATNYYVSNTGSDAANGTSTGTAWQTIAKVNSAMASFQAGDFILFEKGGSFTGTITIGKAGASGNNITISSYGTGAKPIITAAVNNPAITVTAANRGYWTIDGLELRSSGTVVAGMSVSVYFNYWPDDLGSVPGWIIKNCTSNAAFFVSGPNMLIKDNIFDGTGNALAVLGAITIRGAFGTGDIIEGNTVRNWTDRGIWVYNGADNTTIRYNTVYNIIAGSDNDGMGINIDGYAVPESDNKVYGNTAYNCASFGISHENAFNQQTYENTIYNSGGGINIHNYGPTSNKLASNGVLRNNLIYNVNIGIGIAEVKYWTMVNNTIYQGTGTVPAGVKFTLTDTATSNLTFVNNIIAGTWTHPVRVWSTKVVWDQFDYNDIMQNGTTIYLENTIGTNRNLAYVQGLGFMTHGITSDPQFVSASDFHLQAISPAKDVGLNVGLLYKGLAPDMGAFEYNPVGTIRTHNGNILMHNGKIIIKPQ